VDGTAHRRGIPAVELVAYDLPPGEHWLRIVRSHAETGVAFLPIDHRLTAAEKRRLLDRARPTVVIDATAETVYGGGEPSDPERAWAVVATSGTAGKPKLADLPPDALQAAVDGSLVALGLEQGAPWVCCLSPAHIGGLLVLLRAVLGAAAVTVHERFEADRLLASEPGTNVALVPTMLHRLTEAGADLSRLGVLLVGGGPVTPGLRDAAARLGARVVSTYGLTETCGGVAYDGVALPDTSVRIADGTIQVRGPTLMEGYRGDPAETGSAFTTDGWLRTADAGRFDDGRLTVLGRLDDRIRTGAETVWPSEVEAVLRSHPKVADVAVAGIADPEWGESVAAWVVPSDAPDPPRLEELRDHCRDRGLASFKLPRRLTLADRLPKTNGGKLRRRALRPRQPRDRPRDRPGDR
jgi:o-succinylbenzoate---CoA ligase